MKAARSTRLKPTDRKQAIFLLHVMNADGTNIHQISFNTNHDFAPSVLANGQIVFSRYESINGGQISLYRSNPDGTALELYYGENSHATGADIAGTNNNVIQFLNARQMANGKLLAIARPFLGTQLGGDLVQIDAAGFVELHQPADPDGHRRHGAGQRDHARRDHRCGQALDGRSFRIGVSAARRHQPATGELGSLPGPRFERHPGDHQRLHHREHQRRQRANWRRRSTPSGPTTWMRAP